MAGIGQGLREGGYGKVRIALGSTEILHEFVASVRQMTARLFVSDPWA